MGIWGSTVVAVEVPLPEHCCCYGSKPGWFWGPFWLFLAVENQNGPGNFFLKRHMGSTAVAVEIPVPEHCCSYGSKTGWVWGRFWLFLTVENQAGPEKSFLVKKNGHMGSMVVQIEVLLPEYCCSNGSKPRWFCGPFWLLLTAAIQADSGPKK